MSIQQLEHRTIMATKPAAPAAPARRRRRWPWLVVLCLLGLAAGGAYREYPRIAGALSATTKPATTQPARSVPVVAAQARRGDLPIYLPVLGTVTAFNSVTIRTRVDGQLMKVAFVEGQMVHEGDLLAEIDPRPFQVQLTQAEGQKAKDEALLKIANLDHAKYMEAGRAASRQEVDTAAGNVAQYEGAVKADRGQIDSINLQLTYCHITSPLTGRIGLRMVDQGNMVHASDQNGLAVITQLQPIAVRFPLAEDNLPQVLNASAGGQPLTALAYDRDLRYLLATGSLMAIDNQVDPGTGTVQLKAKFENQDNRLFPNQFVNVRLLVDTRKQTVLVPAAAPQQTPQKTNFVYVVKPDQTVDIRPVTLGPTDIDGVLTSVEQGLSPGEIVVTDGVDKLQPGTKVAVRSPESKRGAASQPSEPASAKPVARTPGSQSPARMTPGTQPSAPSSAPTTRKQEHR